MYRYVLDPTIVLKLFQALYLNFNGLFKRGKSSCKGEKVFLSIVVPLYDDVTVCCPNGCLRHSIDSGIEEACLRMCTHTKGFNFEDSLRASFLGRSLGTRPCPAMLSEDPSIIYIHTHAELLLPIDILSMLLHTPKIFFID